MEQDAQIVVAYEITVEDLMAFNQHYIASSPMLRRAKLVYRILPPIIWACLVGTLTLMSGTRTPSLVFAAAMAVTAILWWFVAPRSWENSVNRRLKRLLSEGRNPALLEQHRLTLTRDGIERRSDTSESKTRWTAVERIAETPEHILLYVAAANAHIVPKRAFATPQQSSDFLQAARRFREEAAGLEPAQGGYPQ